MAIQFDDEFSGSGVMADRVPDTAGWIVGGQWKKGIGVNDIDVAGGIATSTTTNPEAQYPLAAVNVDSPPMPGSEGGYTVEARFRVLVSTPVTTYFNLELRDLNDFNWIHFGVYFDSGQHWFFGEAYTNDFANDSYDEVAAVVTEDAWVDFKAVVIPNGTVEVWLDGVLRFTLNMGVPFADLSLKFVKVLVPSNTELEYIRASAVPAPPTPLRWYAHYPAVSGVWEALATTGTDTSPYPADRYYGRSTVAGSAYVWTLDWQTTNGATTPAVVFPDGPDPADIPAGDVNWAPGVSVEELSSGSGYGELRLYCAVDGVPVPGYLWMAWTPNEPNYANLAWGYDAGDSTTPEFWTGFLNTFEVP